MHVQPSTCFHGMWRDNFTLSVRMGHAEIQFSKFKIIHSPAMYDVMNSGRYVRTFRRNELPPFTPKMLGSTFPSKRP